MEGNHRHRPLFDIDDRPSSAALLVTSAARIRAWRGPDVSQVYRSAWRSHR